MDPPVQYPIPSTSSPVDLNPPNNNFQDPSINVSPKNSNRSTSFFAQPGTLAGKFQQKILLQHTVLEIYILVKHVS